MNFFRKLIRNFLAAWVIGMPNFERGKEEVNNAPVEPISSDRVRYAPGGSVEKIDKHYGRTIAGGPGSQKIGDTFAALPQAERDAMIAARKGIIRTTTVDGLDEALKSRDTSSGTDKIARALASGRYRYNQDGLLTERRKP